MLGVILNDAVFFPPLTVDRSSKRRQVKPLAASLLEALDYDSSDDSDFKVGDASGKCFSLPFLRFLELGLFSDFFLIGFD